MWPFHRHQWHEVSRNFGTATKTVVDLGGETFKRDIPQATQITYKCGNDHYKQKVLVGHIMEAPKWQ